MDMDKTRGFDLRVVCGGLTVKMLGYPNRKAFFGAGMWDGNVSITMGSSMHHREPGRKMVFYIAYIRCQIFNTVILYNIIH